MHTELTLFFLGGRIVLLTVELSIDLPFELHVLRPDIIDLDEFVLNGELFHHEFLRVLVYFSLLLIVGVDLIKLLAIIVNNAIMCEVQFLLGDVNLLHFNIAQHDLPIHSVSHQEQKLMREDLIRTVLKNLLTFFIRTHFVPETFGLNFPNGSLQFSSVWLLALKLLAHFLDPLFDQLLRHSAIKQH